MATLKKLLVALGLDKSDYDKGLDDAKRKTQTSADEMSKSLKGIGDKISGTGEKMTAGLTLPIVAGFGVAINSASDLGETFNKTQAVFGDASDEIVSFAENADQSIGQSQQSALDAAGTFGIFGKASGLAGSDLSDFALELTTLSSDFASFYNTSPEEAITAIGAALRGESEPIRKYGVLLDEMTLKNEALKLGLITSDKDALTPQMKTLAAYSAIMAQSSVAQGDFTKTSDGLANSGRIASAQMSNFSAQIGTFLLPLALQLVQAGSGLLTWLTNMDPGMQKVILVVLGLVAGIGPLLMIVGHLITAIGAIMPVAAAIGTFLGGPFLAPIALVVAAIVGLALAWSNNWGGIQEKAKAVLDWLKPYFDGAMKGVQMIFDAFKLAFSGDWEGFGKKIREIWDLGWENIKKAFTGAWDSLKNIDWGELGSNIIQGIANGITGAVDWIVKAAENVGGAALAAIKGFLGISSPSKVMEDEVGLMMGEGAGIGWEKSINRLRGRMAAGMRTVVSAVANVATPDVRAARPVYVGVDYHPQVSFADENEVQQRFKPVVRQALREIQTGG